MKVVNKKLEELTQEEWGELFPIEMIPPQDHWVSIFKKEKERIEELLTKTIALGSIDILIDIPSKSLFNDDIIKKMQGIGYEYCIQNGYGPDYMIFAKGFNREGKKEQQYFVHMTPKSHTELWDRIFFRDYLKQHPNIAKEYENLKKDLTAKFSKNRRSFRQGKTDFVMRVTALAKEKYRTI